MSNKKAVVTDDIELTGQEIMKGDSVVEEFVFTVRRHSNYKKPIHKKESIYVKRKTRVHAKGEAEVFLWVMEQLGDELEMKFYKSHHFTKARVWRYWETLDKTLGTDTLINKMSEMIKLI